MAALVIFNAPIVAVTDYLGSTAFTKRIFFKPQRRNPYFRKSNTAWPCAALLAEIQKWLLRNGHDLRSAELRAYFTQWKRAQEHDGFLLEAPGRWKYFRHLASHPWTYGEIMTRRHRVYSYMRACSALVLGYHHLHLFDDARKKGKEWMASSSEKTLVALPSKAKAATATKS